MQEIQMQRAGYNVVAGPWTLEDAFASLEKVWEPSQAALAKRELRRRLANDVFRMLHQTSLLQEVDEIFAPDDDEDDNQNY